MKQRRFRSDALSAWSLLTPSLTLFIVFVVVPTVVALGLSLFEWHFFDTPTWVGADNLSRLVRDEEVWQSLLVTFEFVILGLAPTVVIGFLLAVLVNVEGRAIGFLRVLYFVPIVVSVAVSGVIWGFLYDPRQGPVAAALRLVGLQLPDLLGNPATAAPALVIMIVWGGLPIVILLYLAGLQRISPDLYAAAHLDGAGRWRTIWSIIWPSVSGTTLVIVVLQIVGFVGGSLDLALVLTNGGPLGSTRALGLYAYQQAFAYQDAGYASAVAVLQLVVIVALVSACQLAIRRVGR